MKEYFILRTENARDRMRDAWELCCSILQHGFACKVWVEPCLPKRTLKQNSKMHAMLHDLSRQVDMEVMRGGVRYKRKLTPPEWKDWITAQLLGESEMVESIDGDAFILLGRSTSQMTIEEMGNVIELAYSIGAAKGVEWTEPKKETADENS